MFMCTCSLAGWVLETSTVTLSFRTGRESDPNDKADDAHLFGSVHNARTPQACRQDIATHISDKFSAMNRHYFYSKHSVIETIPLIITPSLTFLYSLRLFM